MSAVQEKMGSYCLLLLLVFIPLLPCGHCQDKTESFLPSDVTSSRQTKDLSEGGWKVWEQASKPVDWTKASQHQSVPFSLEEQKKWQQHGGSTKKTKKGADKKSTSKPFDFGIDEIRRMLLKHGRSVLDFVTGQGAIMGLRTFFPDSASAFSSRQSGGAGVVDWLSRLIGVQGKSLGEFLREYQVHVLYDLVFTFFKWIFFLYAGLLIP